MNPWSSPRENSLQRQVDNLTHNMDQQIEINKNLIGANKAMQKNIDLLWERLDTVNKRLTVELDTLKLNDKLKKMEGLDDPVYL